jgi:uncharacterized SAM-binding protein YcdF (DUF218 family)
VTDGSHLDRAVRCFRKQGIDPVPCGCRYGSLQFQGEVTEFLFNPAAARGARTALHEWIGMAWYALRGRI